MSNLTTTIRLNGVLDEVSLKKAKEELSKQGVEQLTDLGGGFALRVKYDPSRISYNELIAKLRSYGIPAS